MTGGKTVVPRRETGPQPDDRLRTGMYQSDVDRVVGLLQEIAVKVDAHSSDPTLRQALRAFTARLDANTEATNRLVEALQTTHSLISRTQDAAASIPSQVERAMETMISPQLRALLSQVVDGKAKVERIATEVRSAVTQVLSRTEPKQTPGTCAPSPNERPLAAPSGERRFGEAAEAQGGRTQAGESIVATPLPASVVDQIKRDLGAIKLLLPDSETVAVTPDQHAKAIGDLQKHRDALPREQGIIPRWIRERLKDIHRAIANQKWVAARKGIDELLRSIRPAADPQASPEGSPPGSSTSKAESAQSTAQKPGGESSAPRAVNPSDNDKTDKAANQPHSPQRNSPEGSVAKGAREPGSKTEQNARTGGVLEHRQANRPDERPLSSRSTTEGNPRQSAAPDQRPANVEPRGIASPRPLANRSQPGGVPGKGDPGSPEVDPFLEEVTGGLVS